MVPQHRLHQDDSAQPSSSSLPLSAPASTSSVRQNPQDKDKGSTSPTTNTPTPASFIYPYGLSQANLKAKLKPSTTDPSPTWFKGLRLLKDKTKKPDKGKQRERDRHVEDGSEMHMPSISMKSGGSESTLNSLPVGSGLWLSFDG